MAEENINNQEVVTPPSEAGAAKTEVKVDENENVPFHKHPRWQELTKELSETKSVVEQVNTGLQQLLEAKTPAERQDIVADWEKLIDENPAKTESELFKKFRDFSKRLDAQDAEKQTAESQKAEEATTNQILEQLNDLVAEGKIQESEFAPFLEWVNQQLNAGKSPAKYGNMFAAYPEWAELRTSSAEAKKAEEVKKVESGVASSGKPTSGVTQVSSEDLSKMSLGEALKRSRAA